MKTHPNLKSMILVFEDWSHNAFKGIILQFLPMVRQVVARHLPWEQPQARKFHIKTEESYQEWFKTFFRKFQRMDQNIDTLSKQLFCKFTMNISSICWVKIMQIQRLTRKTIWLPFGKKKMVQWQFMEQIKKNFFQSKICFNF